MSALDEKLDRELAWRKKEVLSLSLQAESTEGEIQRALLRAAWVMLYAHWEGFIKSSTEIYVKFVNRKQIECKHLLCNFAILLFKKEIEELSVTGQNKRARVIYEKILSAQDVFIKLYEEIDTKSNLGGDMFDNILSLLAIEDDFYTSKIHLINDLVKTRNEIAHGQGSTITIARFLDMRNSILEIMTYYNQNLCDFYVDEKYKKIVIPQSPEILSQLEATI